MTFPYKHVLIVGATSGIGAALAERFIETDSRVTVTGRRVDRLQAFVAKHGAEKASYVEFDVTSTSGIDALVRTITTQYPDIDCIISNAGSMHPFDLSKPSEINLETFHDEVNLNFTSSVNFAVKVLPFLLAKPSTLVFVGSHVGFVPIANLPAYCASKAALQTFVLCLQEQMRSTSVKVVDLWPPVIKTEIGKHIEGPQADHESMSMGDFLDHSFKALEAGQDAIIVGEGPAPKAVFDPAVQGRREMFEGLAAMMRGPHS